MSPRGDDSRSPRAGRCLECPRAAVDPLQQSLAREQLEIPVNGDGRDLEVPRELGYRCAAVAARGAWRRHRAPSPGKDQSLTTTLASVFNTCQGMSGTSRSPLDPAAAGQ